MAAEQDFESKLLQSLDQAEKLIGGYQFIGLRTLIEENGAVEAARKLVNLDRVTKSYDGFEVLAKHGLLNLSVEQAIVDFADKSLFSRPEVDSAKTRLILKRGK